ncbi:ArnT family glycosyltransferase [Mangrovibacterium sp.]|uniref:ArnT family glycosyltransferase n=1 Tax=Mangrovibacterium sp. TaxID=1961364 RepID=UPI003569BB62
MIDKLSSYKFYPLLVFLLAWSLYLFNSGAVSIYILDEAKNAECAREMLERADFFVPTFNQELRTDKPPLHYFFMMLSYSVFGVNPFAARFFSALFGALTVLIATLFARQFAGSKTGLITGGVLLASVHLSIQFHLAVPDPYLVFFMSVAICSFYTFLENRKIVYLIALYGSIGLGTLTKGPIAIALPGLIFLLYLISSKQLNWPTLRTLRPFWGAAFVLLIAMPWYILAHLKTNGAWTEGFFLRHNIGRFTDEMEGHGGTFVATLLFVLIGLFPFSVYLPQALVEGFRNRKERFILFNLLAGLCIVGFFMLSKTRLPNYTVPALPFLAILIGQFIVNNRNRPKAFTAGIWTIFIFSVILVPALIVGLKFDPSLADIRWVGWYFVPFPLLVGTALFFHFQKKLPLMHLFTLFAGMAVALIFFAVVFPKIDRQNPVAKSIELLQGKEVRYFRKFNAAYAFNLKKELPPLQDNELAPFFKQYPDGVVISTRKKVNEIALPEGCEISFSSHDLFESPVTVFITKRKP